MPMNAQLANLAIAFLKRVQLTWEEAPAAHALAEALAECAKPQPQPLPLPVVRNDPVNHE